MIAILEEEKNPLITMADSEAPAVVQTEDERRAGIMARLAEAKAARAKQEAETAAATASAAAEGEI